MSCLFRAGALFACIATVACASAEPRRATLTGDYLAGRLAARVNAVDAAARAYAEAYRVSPGNPELMREAFYFHVAAGDIDGAAVFAERLFRLDGDEAARGLPQAVLATKALKSGDYAGASRYLSAEISDPYVKSAAYLTSAWIDAARSGPEAAIARLDNPPADVFAGFNPLHRGLLAEQAGRPEEARLYLQASAMTLGGPVGRTAYGAFLERHGEPAAAREYYEAFLGESGPGRKVAEAGLRRLERGKPSQEFSKVDAARGAAISFHAFAGAMIEQAAALRQRAIEAGFRIGDPQFNLPLSFARLALYLDPNFDEARRLVALILSIYGDDRTAYSTLEAVSPSSPHFEQARIEMAGALVREEKGPAAASILENAIRRGADGPEIRWTLSNIYSTIGRHQAAVSALDAVLAAPETAPARDLWRYYLSRGAAFLELDRWEDAERDLKRAVELAPEEATALNYLGYSWAERGLNLDEAFALIEKAVSLEPRSGAIIDSLGWAHFQRGDFAAALPHLEKAASLEPDDPTITEHLGDVYWRLGRETEARFQWRRARELNPPEKAREAIEKKLERGLQPLQQPASTGAADEDA